jgi:tetratricopeptide (TPR) repeat protein
MKCQDCSLESDRADLFRIVNRFLKPRTALCLACFQEAEHKTNKLFVWSFLIIGIAALPLILWRPTHAIGFILLCISIFQLGALISTILHELGHAVAGRAAGFRIFAIEIGQGRIVYDFFLGKVRWCFRAIPFGGLTHGVPRTMEYYRSRRCVFIIGGPLVNAILTLIAIILLPLDDQLDSTPFDGVAPFLFLALSNAALLLFNLWPHMVNSVRGRIPNDALGLWRTLRNKETQTNELLSWRYLYEASERQRKKDLEGAEAWIREGLQKFPESVALKISAAGILYLQKKYHEAARSYALVAGRSKVSKEMDAHILNGVAYCYLLAGKPEFLTKADTCSRLALKQSPKYPAYKGTRGSVLAELGKYDEGLKLLHEAMKSHTQNSQQALCACYIGIAEARLGNLAESHNYFAVARRLDPDCILLDREQPTQKA